MSNSEKGFYKADFMSYLEGTYSGFQNPFLRETVENIIDYATAHEHVSKDQFVYFVSDMLPEITFGEVAYFTEDGCLTENGIALKAEFAKQYDRRPQKKETLVAKGTLLQLLFAVNADEYEFGKDAKEYEYGDCYSVVVENEADTETLEDGFAACFDTVTDYQNAEAVETVLDLSGVKWHWYADGEAICTTKTIYI